MGSLAGIKIVEFEGVEPAPFCCMLLSDPGADVLRIDRVVASDGLARLPGGAGLLAQQAAKA